MFDVFGNIKSLLKIQTVCIDNHIFRLHYQLTLICLFLFSILVNSRQYFGDPIDCTSDPTDKTTRVIDNYCWMHIYRPAGLYAEHSINGIAVVKQKEQRYLVYYQWIGFILFFQAILFFIPRFLWKFCWEEGKVKGLAVGMKGPCLDGDKESQRKKHILDYLERHVGNHNLYFFRYIVCEILNLINVVMQMYIVDRIAGYTFSNFGKRVFEFVNDIPELRKDALNEAFPKVASCTFKTYGVNGDVVKHPTLCVLPVNIFSERIFVLLWFWFIVLTFLTCAGLFYRVLSFIPVVRAYFLHRKTKSVDLSITKAITRNIAVGDWFLLYQIGKNIDALVFGEILKEFGDRVLKHKYNELEHLKP